MTATAITPAASSAEAHATRPRDQHAPGPMPGTARKSSEPRIHHRSHAILYR